MTATSKLYPYTAQVEVVFRDLDALGHVNNAVYFTYLEIARIKYLVELLELKKLTDLSVIVAEASCTYKSPAFFGDRLRVGVGVARLGGKSFELAYQISADDGRLVATARTVQVMYDYAAARAIPLPESFKARVQAFQGQWQKE